MTVMALPETARLVFFSKKAHSGKKRKLIRAVMNPPVYPATRSRGLVSPPLVEETEHLQLDRPGRLAPRWLEDFISGELDDFPPPVQDVGCANAVFRRDTARSRSSSSPADADPPTLRHELLLKGHQSSQGDASEATRCADGTECDEVYSCVCQNCRYHFTFYIERKNSTSCGLNHGNKRDPFHHLVLLANETSSPKLADNRFYPYHGHSNFICSAQHCSFQLTVEVSEPRLNKHFLDYLTDNDSIHSRLQRALEEEPERFADVANVAPNALTYLWFYLRDTVERKTTKDASGADVEVERKIDQRNKKFYIQFGNGPDAAELFTYLGFEEMVDGDNRSWKVPCPPITRPTRPGSQLAFYQDIKSEVETIIGKDSQNMKPNAAISFITNALDIGDYAVSDQADNSLYELNSYAFLGLVPNMHESYFWYAFSCQRQTMPVRTLDFFRCLQQLAQGRNNEELELRVQSYDSMHTNQPVAPKQREVDTEEDEIRRATELSLQDIQPEPLAVAAAAAAQQTHDDPVTAAYKYFGLPEGQRTDDEVLGKYVSLCDAYPSQRTSYREKLLHIARHTGSRNLQDMAAEDMTAEEALSYLGVQVGTERSYIINIAQFACSSGEKDYALVAAALRTIAIARNYDQMLLNAAVEIEAERGQIYDFSNMPTAQMDLDLGPKAPANLALPVGLENIRNTCYLNSILQYLFTVKPIREIVLDIDQYGLPDSEDSLEHRRIDPGSTHLEKGEAYAGRQFVMQLAALFRDLSECPESSLRPPQRLALAALKNSKQLETDGAKILAKEQDHALSFDLGGHSGRQSPAPPLPARHAPVPPVPPRTNNTTIMINPPPSPKVAIRALSDVDNTEPSSARSSLTLVHASDESWQKVSQVSVNMEEVHAEDEPMATHVEQTDMSSSMDMLPSYEDAMSADNHDIKMDDAPPAPVVYGPQVSPAAAADDSRIQETAPGGVQIVFDPPPVAEPGVQEKIASALNDSSVTGTDQQDVEEVMGNIISHLRAAVKSTGEDTETGLQKDPITDTFFWTSATYNRSNGAEKYNRQVAPNRWVTAYPDEGGKVISLLQALDNSFQREFITQGTTRYERFTSILNLPPILHVHIQRTRGDGGKNNTAIDIPEALHLDRFMDSPVDSELFARRRRAWNLQERIRSLKGPNGEKSELEYPPEAIGKASAYTDQLVAEYLASHDDGTEDGGEPMEQDTDEDKAGPTSDGGISLGVDGQGSATDGTAGGTADDGGAVDQDGYVIITDDMKMLLDSEGIVVESTDAVDVQINEEVDKILVNKMGTGDADKAFLEEVRGMKPAQVRDAWMHQDSVAAVNDMMASLPSKAAEYERELTGLFDGLEAPEHTYRLHAVVCHAGQSGKSGHYWVWVYDFARCVWRRYNDSIVTEEPDTAKVVRQLSTQGEPYYLAYVRASDVDSMVDVTLRQDALPPPPPLPPPSMSLPPSMLPTVPEEVEPKSLGIGAATLPGHIAPALAPPSDSGLPTPSTTTSSSTAESSSTSTSESPPMSAAVEHVEYATEHVEHVEHPEPATVAQAARAAGIPVLPSHLARPTLTPPQEEEEEEPPSPKAVGGLDGLHDVPPPPPPPANPADAGDKQQDQ